MASLEQPWTIDSIAHAISIPDVRQNFFRETNLAPVDRLPQVLARWIRYIETREAERPGIEQVRSHYQQYGELPSEYQPTNDADARFAEMRRASAARRQEHAA